MLVMISPRGVNKKTARKMQRLNRKKIMNRQDSIDDENERQGPVRGPNGVESFYHPS